MKKNVASQTVSAVVVSATDGSAVTASVSVTVTGDAGTQGAGGGTLTHEGGGEWSYVPTQAETNFDHIMFKFSATGAVPVGIQVYTTFPQTGDSYARLGAPAGASVSADVAAVQADTDNIQTRLPTSLVSGRIDASVGAMAANVLTASAINAAALNGKGDWNIGKTGYALSSAGIQAIWDALTSALTTVGSVGKLLVDNLNATITSRMASYTQPTGFLAATFPTTVASPTNITAGTITTVTNLTNAPTAGDFTATMKTSLNAATPAVTVSSGGITSGSFAASAIDAAALATDAGAEIATAVLGATVETGATVAQSLRLANGVLGGKASGLDTSTAVFRDLADSKNRITATTDVDGNRTAVTTDLT